MMMKKQKGSDIKKSIKAILAVKVDDIILRTFARKELIKMKFFHETREFDGYEILNENTIRVKYHTNQGDLKTENSIDVKID